jgi:hypothetical protein
MELSQKEKKAFLRAFGQKLSEAIYQKYGTKAKFLRETGYDKVALHQVIMGGDTRLATAYKLARALGVKVKDLLPEE